MKVILQHDTRDCGAACFAMIASHFGVPLTIPQCRELTKTDRAGTNIYGLVHGSEVIGLKADALSGTVNDLTNGLTKNEFSFPFIAHTISESALPHFVVVREYKNNTFYVADPAKGEVKYSVDEFVQIWTGYIVIFKKTRNLEKTREVHRRNKLSLRQLLTGQHIRLMVVLFLSLIVACIGIAGSFVFEIVIDCLQGGINQSSAVPQQIVSKLMIRCGENYETYPILFCTLLGLYVLQAFIQYIRGYLVVTVAKNIDNQLMISYFFRLVGLPISALSLRQTGDYLSRFSDTINIRIAISSATVTLLMDSVMVIGCGIILYSLNTKLFIVSFAMVLLYVFFVVIYRKPIEKRNRNLMEQNGVVQSYLKEIVDGVDTIKAFNAEEQTKQAGKRKIDGFIQAIFKGSILSVSQDTLSQSVETIGTVIILWIGFGMVSNGIITIGALITFYALLAYFTTPIKNLIDLQPTIQTALVAADRLNDILEMEVEKKEEGETTLPKVTEWRMEDIDFRYGNRELTLQNVDFSIQRGQKIGIVGESGSGKTTLAKLLLRFYEPENGKITIDGKSIQEFGLAALRNAVAYVSQNTFLFSDTIKNNLRLGMENCSDEEIARACALSRADAFIKELPFEYDMPLDENGANLSGGQRQRLAIARALLKKPQLMILDEATSNLDSISEAAIKETINGINKDMSCLIIAHRLATVRECDVIYVMEKGRIIERGSHSELMQLNGKYADMVRKQ